MRHFKTAVVGATELEHVVASVIWRHHVLSLITSLMYSATSIHSFSYSWFGEVGGVLHRLWRCIIMNLRQPSLFFAFSVRTWDLLRLSQMSIIESAVSIFGVVRADVAVADWFVVVLTIPHLITHIHTRNLSEIIALIAHAYVVSIMILHSHDILLNNITFSNSIWFLTVSTDAIARLSGECAAGAALSDRFKVDGTFDEFVFGVLF